MTYFVILAVHNRRSLTVAAVSAISSAAERTGAKLEFVVFDDGSTDGTVDAVRRLGQSLEVIHGDGSCFWAASMAAAEKAALNRAEDADFIIWLNDDVIVDLNLFEVLGNLPNERILVGAMRDPISGEPTYGGFAKSGVHPLRFDPILPQDQLIRIDTFNGNLVVVPVSIARIIGGIDGGYAHSLADYDYGIRARAKKLPVYLMPGTVGTCPRNPPFSGSVLAKWRNYLGVKGGGHPRSLRRVLSKAAPKSWPFFYVGSYAVWWVRQLASKARDHGVARG